MLLDDRTASPGVKFKDAELIGVPWILVVGRGWANGTVELRNRFDGRSGRFRWILRWPRSPLYSLPPGNDVVIGQAPRTRFQRPTGLPIG